MGYDWQVPNQENQIGVGRQGETRSGRDATLGTSPLAL